MSDNNESVQDAAPAPLREEAPAARSGERIAKLLARAGIASRREVERMIDEGRVKIGEEVVTTANTVLESLRGVTVDGNPVKAAEAARLFVFHKPAGLITAEHDPAGRPTIYTALRNALPPGTPRMMPIGRLDFSTEGLLLLTNDGELKRAMELPSSGIPRTYRARAFGDITQEQLESLIEGIEIDGMRYGRIDANMERRTGRNQWIEMTITEGKNREVRNVLEHLGLEVSRLLRIAYGPFKLLDLPRGLAVEVRQSDVERFVKSLKLPGATAALPPPRYAETMARARVQRSHNDGSRSAVERPVAARAAHSRPAGPRAAEPERADSRPAPKPARRPLARKPRDDGKLIDRPARPRSDALGDRRPSTGRPTDGKPSFGKPGAGRPSERRPSADRPSADRTSADRPTSSRPYADRPSSDRSNPRSPDPRSSGPRSSDPRNSGPRKPGPRK